MILAGLIDELSLLVAPISDGRIGTPALFDVDGTDAKAASAITPVGRAALGRGNLAALLLTVATG